MKKSYILPALFVFAVAGSASGQQFGTSYFMTGSVLRTEVNPALRPERGYVKIPVIGMANVNYASNALQLNNLFYPKDGALVSFLDRSVSADGFLSTLNSMNTLAVGARTSVLGAGFFSGRSFFSLDVYLRLTSEAGLPKQLFEFMKLGSGAEGGTYDLSGLSLSAGLYAEAALGWSYKVGKWVTVGAKAKYLGGLGRVSMNYDRLDLKFSDESWEIQATGNLEVMSKGTEFRDKSDGGKEYIDLDFDRMKFKGLAGSGFAFDFGVEWDVLGYVKVSASVLDLGMIRWSEGSTTRGVSEGSYSFGGFDIVDGVDKGASSADDFEDFTRFTRQEPRKTNSRLVSTFVVGAEWPVVRDFFSLGALWALENREFNNRNQFTLSATLRLFDWLSGALSYTLDSEKSARNVFGVVLCFHPKWINFYLGSDFLTTKYSPQMIPVRQKAMNLYCGLSIPITRNRYIGANSL